MERFKIDDSYRKLILWELIFPTILLVLGVYHGLLQTLYRAGIIKAAEFLGLEYYQGLTLHGVVNAVVFTTYFAVAFGNALILYYLRKYYNKTVAWASFWMMTIGTLLAAYTILTRQASVLYTFYPPLKAHPLFYIGAALLIVGSWVAFFNWIPVLNAWRKENQGQKMPLAVLGIFATFIIWFVATLAVAIEVIFMLIPWSLGWVEAINIPLARSLFWFFGHPLVYFWLLPAYIMYYVFLPKIAGGKLFSDNAGRLVFLLFILFSVPVGVHHQYTEPGIGTGLKLIHAVFTFAVAIPSLITAFTIAASLEYAGRKRGATGLLDWLWKLPYFDSKNYMFPYFMMGLFIFIFGGITGVVNASYGMNLVVHNTSWIPGHFHLTVAGPVILAAFAASIWMAEKLTGKKNISPKISVWIPYLWTLGLAFFSTPMMINGIMGEPRRTNLGLTYSNPDSPLYHAEWHTNTILSAIGGIILFITALLFFYVFFGTLLSQKVEEPALEFPTAEPLEQEQRVPVLDTFKTWIIILVLLIVVSYAPAIKDALDNAYYKAPRYEINNPMPDGKPIPTNISK